ncbi:hypothetical protein EDC96DRAFT_442052, partial [Choanephora cucurbitarum]
QHSLYTSVCIINEYNTPQACLFCFRTIRQSLEVAKKDGKEGLKVINGTCVCSNKTCILN